MNYIEFSNRIRKQAATVMTPEAEAAAMQGPPPMPPQGAPMDPAMMGGQPPMDPSMAGVAPMATGPQGGQIPPEIMQDQAFIQFLMQMGVQLDQASGTFIGPDGQPVPADMIIQAYQQFQQMIAQQGGMPPQGAPMDPAMMGGQPPMDPSMAGVAPMPPQGAPMDPAMMGGQPPMDPSMQGGAPAIPDDIMNQISTAVMSGVESVLQDFSQQVGKVLQDLNDKLDKLSGDIASLSDVDDRRTADDRKAEDSLRAELSADLNPTVPASIQEEPVKQASAGRKLNIFDLINGR